MLIHREHNKAQHYLNLLDNARCDGRWHEVPELVRKVRKHAPQRICLALTAESESKVATVSQRQTTAPPLTDHLSQLTTLLAEAIGNEKTFPEDAFQARVCIGWVYWTIGKPSLVVPELAVSLATALHQFGQGGTGATRVALLRGAYLLGMSLEHIGSFTKAAQCYESVSPYITQSRTTASNSEQRTLAETILMRHCMLAYRSLQDSEKGPGSKRSALLPDSLLTPFRNWAVFWEANLVQAYKSPIGIDVQYNQVRKVWQAYYDILSMALQQHIPYPSSSSELSLAQVKSTSTSQHIPYSSNLLQSQELRRVQTIYEGLLMKDLQFPKANVVNAEVQHWVDQVMANWRILCGPLWNDKDLGEGGKRAAGQGVLEILYRAATKSFHSTSILRYLFTVHKALAEFDLASRALDIYIDIVTKGQARADNSGEPDVGLDKDECAIETAAAGIAMYCTYGKRKEAEKAQKLAIVLQNWLQRHFQDGLPDRSQGPSIKSWASQYSTSLPISGKALAQGYRALGMSQANWARHTFETQDRPGLQAKAITSFRQAHDLDPINEQSLEILYGFALILAETRDLDSAIAVTKRALSLESKQKQWPNLQQYGQDDLMGISRLHRSTEKRQFLRLWHLLALLLSARQDYATAVVSCEAALDVIGGDPTLREGSDDETTEQNLELNERQNVIEIKMTQLAITAITETPEDAVNATGDILALYARFFKSSQAQAEGISQVNIASEGLSHPESTNGTLKSIRGSFFGRPKKNDSNPGVHGEETASNKAALAKSNSTANVTTNPTISITAEDYRRISHEKTHHHHLFHHESKKLQKGNSKRSIDGNRRSRPGSSDNSGTVDGFNEQPKPSTPLHPRQTLSSEGRPGSTQVGVALASDPPPSSLPPTANNRTTFTQSQIPVAHNIFSTKTYPLQHVLNPPFPNWSTKDPLPCFFRPECERLALSLLTKIWLFIAGLYQRAKMYEDAQGALSEATAQVRLIEAVVASHSCSAQAFAEPGWSGVKSVDELWADVYCEEATLHTCLGSYGDAAQEYEKALQRFPDHPGAIVGLSSILLDRYTRNVSDASRESTTLDISPSIPILAGVPSNHSSLAALSPGDKDQAQSLISHLAARDRAYGLLSSLTKSGRGWDNSEAWFALAKAYEDGGQLEKAKEALWWVVELEEKRPVRGWDALGQGYEL